MRVIAGTARSLPLKAPKGLRTRPTQDQTKETVFNILREDISGSIFVDLFSGSGGIGIEALSRGARRAYFVDQDHASCACIHENLIFTKLLDRAIVLKQNFATALRSISESHIDILFMDPPYGKGLEVESCKILRTLPSIDDKTILVIETAIDMDLEQLTKLGFTIVRQKQYKTNQHLFIKKENCETI
ncbi:MAG: 16S rRNA (guanine(966)-N(2))-methyltransferase RsmD [Lachnospiraceae bacterium]|jgi:16S rRNA (guanine966-N2)-methyltransferase|nr:16S rRNA (guanine(966)-N(2))-methyltransferase RsmD [Lachnospiraceae bacterium]